MTIKQTKIEKPEAVSYYALNNEINLPIDGKIPLHKDKEAARAYFLEHVNPNTVFFSNLEEKINYLIENNYIEKEFIEKYSMKFIKSLFKKLYNKKFRFNTFMGAHKFYEQYAMKTNDKKRFLERYEDRIAFVSLYLANGDENLALNLAEEMIERRFQPATPTFLNSGKARRGELVSCFLIDTFDNMESIGRTITNSLQLSKKGGGCGINLSNIREAGAPIKGVVNASSGVVPVMKLLEDLFSYANQLGQRQGAGAVYLSIHHPDIIAFLSTKKENADEKVRVKTLSLGLILTDKFYEAVKNNEEMFLFSPYDVERVYNKPFSYIDITNEYDNLVNNEEITKYKINARDLENEISKLQQESGYPYILNIDNANRSNPNQDRILMSNLCSEILQGQKPSIMNNKQEYEVIGEDISCNLGSLNISNMMKSKDFEKSVETAVRALTFVSDNTNIEEVPTIKKGNQNNHSIGLGAMGLHGFLAKNQIEYGNEESIEFVDLFFRTVNYYTLVASNKIAKEKNETYKDFYVSKYYTGEYFNPYIKENIEIKSPKLKSLFKNINIPNQDDWKRLAKDVKAYGLYHSYRQAIAPTGSISYVNEATASLHPIIQRIEERQEKKTGKTYYPAPDLSEKTIPYYKSAYDIDMRKMIDIYATAQKHIDQGMSLTLFMRSEIPEGLYEWKKGRTNKMTTRDLNILRHYANNKGIKSLYYVRTFTSDNKEQGANECESCSI